MLQQTPVVRVIPPLEQWLRRWPTPADLAADSPGEAVRAWASLGYPRRALNLHAAAVAITSRHGGEVPLTVTELLALPGVGDYTARAVAVFAHGQRHPVVDTNVRRVIARAIEGVAEPAAPSNRRDLEAMAAILPADLEQSRVANAAIMELGAVVCVARRPRCAECPIAEQCAWRSADYPEFAGVRRPVQKKFEGSDRQLRGKILNILRASDVAVLLPEPPELVASDPQFEQQQLDQHQFRRALAGLLADGLVTGNPTNGYSLPA